MSGSARLWLVPAYLILCLVLGGASAAGLWANAFLQLLAIPLLFWAFVDTWAEPMSRSARQLLALTAAALVIVLVQLVPLPPSVWASLPGREPIVDAYALMGRPLPWMPVSLAPYSTLMALLWMLPALAVLVAMLRHGAAEGTRIGWAIAAVMALSVLVGAMQITGGDESRWYFYRVTNYGVTVGFFSNANHMATLLAVSLPFIAAIYMGGATAPPSESRGRSSRRGSRRGASHRSPQALLVIVGGLFLLVAIGLVINGSLAGLGLMVPVAAASVLMMLKRRPPLWAIGLLALLTLASVAAVFSGRFDNNLINAEAEKSAVSRYTTFTTSYEAVKDHFPLGSGLGSFQPVYRMYEDRDQVTTTYINHVHSDWIEWVLETGLPGLIVMILFLAWWLRRTVQIWRAPEPVHIARAATIASAAIIAHSLVDYPLRTAAISAIFAACCALMAQGRPQVKRSADHRPPMRPSRHLSAD